MLKFTKQLYLKQKYNFTFERISKQVEVPYFVLAKHKSPIDSLLLSCAIPHSTIFADETVSADKLERLFNKYQCVAILSSKCSNFGEDVSFSENITEILANSKYPIIFYNLIGDYFSKPSWSRKSNRGVCRGFIKKTMHPADFEKLNAHQIMELINENLSISDYDTEELKAASYKGSHKAEFIENAAKVCPVCKKTDTLRSAKNEIFCTHCAARASFDEKMHLTGDFDVKSLIENNLIL